MVRIAVVGAGAVGLSTAVCLQQRVPAAEITLVADKFTTATTSHGAAGLFRPTIAKTPGVHPDKLRKWMRTSVKHIRGILNSPEAGLAGVSLVSGYIVHDEYKPWPLYSEIALHFRDLTEAELDALPGPRHKYGWYLSTPLCECSHYLPYLTDKFVKAGGRIKKRKLVSLLELHGDFDLVVNCAGYGNKELTGDRRLEPNRGHLIRVQAPWIKHLFYVDENCYIIPCIDNVVVGGTRQSGREDLQPLEEDHKAIWREACNAMPSLQRAKVLWDWVGIRPIRPPLRLESEVITDGQGKTLKVVHNYGHGGEGVTLSWGTAMEACDLVRQSLGLSVVESKL